MRQGIPIRNSAPTREAVDRTIEGICALCNQRVLYVVIHAPINIRRTDDDGNDVLDKVPYVFRTKKGYLPHEDGTFHFCKDLDVPRYRPHRCSGRHRTHREK